MLITEDVQPLVLRPGGRSEGVFAQQGIAHAATLVVDLVVAEEWSSPRANVRGSA